MTNIQILKTLPFYLEYFLKVTDNHSLQSPFMFKFYNDLNRAIEEDGIHSDIEAVRQQLQSADSVVSGTDYGAGSRISAVSVSDIGKFGISSEKDCRMLFALAQLTKTKTIVELGTSIGVATAYLSRANEKGRVFTFEGNSSLAKIAEGVFQQLYCNNITLVEGDINETLPEFLENIDEVDVAVVDANHTGEALLRYYGLLKEKMSETGIMVVDDIRWSSDMYKAWKKLIADKEATISVEFLHCGVIFFQKNFLKQHYILSY